MPSDLALSSLPGVEVRGGTDIKGVATSRTQGENWEGYAVPLNLFRLKGSYARPGDRGL